MEAPDEKPHDEGRQKGTLDISLQNLADSIEDPLVVIDTEYHIVLANAAAAAQSRNEAHLSGAFCYQALQQRDSPCHAPLWDCPLEKVLAKGNMTSFVHPMGAHGAERYVKIAMYPLRDGKGRTTAAVEIRKDVTAERELETEILRHRHQLLALGRISSAVTELRDLDAILKIALDNVLEISGSAIGGILIVDEATKTLSYQVQQGLSARFAEEMRIRLGEGIVGSVAQSGEPIVLDNVAEDPRIVRPDLVSAEGLKGFISIPLKATDKVVMGVMNVASHTAGRFGPDDVALLGSIGDYLGTAIEQARLYSRLEKAGERYRALLQHALAAQEEERKRIARELHDETSQSITSLTLQLQAVIGLAEMKGIADEEFTNKLKLTHSCAVRAGSEIVKLMKELRPTLLDELGMSAAIHRYAKDTLEPRGISISTEFGIEQRLQPEVELALFRIAQGAIGNILEHSGAKKASIKLECNSEQCVLHIEDDGKGFDVGKLTKISPSGRGAGIFTIKERARLIGGDCNVESQPGQGTQIEVKIPLVREGLDEENTGAGGG